MPILYGNIDFDTNKFKDIEKKYMKNIDEWLCNLYIQVKKIELFDFRYHEEKIEFLVPKKWQKKLQLQQEATKKLIEDRIRRGGANERDEDDSEPESATDKGDEEGSDYSSSDSSVDSDLGFDSAAVEVLENQKYEDDSKINFYDYNYCICLLYTSPSPRDRG